MYRLTFLLFFIAFLPILKAQNIEIIESYESIHRSPTSNLTISPQAKIWCTYRNECYTFDGQNFELFNEINSTEVSPVFIHGSDKFDYFRTPSNVIALHRNSTMYTPLLDQKTKKVHYAAVIDMAVYISTNQGLEIVSIDDLERKTVESIPFPKVRDIQKLENNEYWFATSNGIRIIKDGRLINEPAIKSLLNIPSKRILKDQLEHLWILDDYNTWHKYNGKKLETVYFEQDSSNIAYSDATIIGNTIWAVGPKIGLHSFDTQERTRNTIAIRDSILLIGYKEIEHDSFRQIWLAGPRGILRLDLSDETSAPALAINDIQVLFKPIDREDNLSIGYFQKKHFKPDQNYISFEYFGGNLGPEKVSYQYKLEGKDEHWSPWNYETKVHYNSLDPGTYNFKVRAKSKDQISERSSGTFIISTPFLQKPWVRNNGILLIIGLVGFLLCDKYE